MRGADTKVVAVLKGSEQIPPKGVVRFVAAIILVIGVALMVIAVTNAVALGWYALLVFVSGLTSAGFAVVALRTGKPEWILLDMLFPS